MKIIMKFFLAIFFGFIGNDMMSQTKNDFNKRYLATLHEYEIINPQIYEVLDSVISYTQYCPCSILSKPYHLWITFEDSMMRVESLQYNVALIHDFNSNNSIERGFFYYKNKLVLIEDYQGWTNLFFRPVKSVQEIFYQWDSNIINLMRTGYESVIKFYNYVDNKLVLNMDDGRFCNSSSSFFYIIQKNDTWQSIADKIGCSTDMLQNVRGMREENLPEEGFLIMMQYDFEGKSFIRAIRWQ